VTAPLGRGLVDLALLIATSGAMVSFAAGVRRSPAAVRLAQRFAYAFSATMIAANLVMLYALLTHDFSVSYVQQVGSRALPTWVTIASLWSSLEGSILFWGLILAVYIAGTTWIHRDHHAEAMPFAIGVWLACAAFFSFLIAGPAQPFLTVVSPPADGPGPNPLLQNHLLMAIHPPFLYLGFVGMTIPFGLACAALMTGRLGHDFLRPLRSSLLLPWCFLTVAIMLGGWWSYEVLGWGGYWAWDPVENASFLPWLTATAALHSAIVMERKSVLKGWTVTLVLATFLLTILGTFMTRSGVFNSVHSFTQSSIGPTILVFLGIAIVGSVVLLATRIDRIAAEGELEVGASRETFFLVQNLLFVVFTFTVLIGTVFPLVVEAAKGVQMSVGRPYFDKMSVPIGLTLLFLMGVGPALPWGRANGEQVRRALLPPLIGAFLAAAIGAALGVRAPWTLLAIAFGGYTMWITLREMWLPVHQRMRARGEGLGEAVVTAQWQRGRRRFGSYLVHGAAVVVIVAIAVSSTMGKVIEVRLAKGESAKIGDYELTMIGAEERSEPHRLSTLARIGVKRDGLEVAVMEPRMNHYQGQREPIGTPDVRTTLTHDLYLSVMSVDVGAQTVGLHAMVNPMVGWIWIAVGFMGLGGLIALLPQRRASMIAAIPLPLEVPRGAGALAEEG